MSVNNYFNGDKLDLDALFKIFGVKNDYKKTDPAAPVYSPQIGTPGPQPDIAGVMGSLAPMAGNMSQVNYNSAIPPANGAFWLQDIVNRAHNATRQTTPVSGGGK